ncbi:hypothetical protein TNCV_222071 [Trichonephila clavipes]|nr:hypothetical protein TNCV_222071 [Trichonephila clavipes]
MISPDCLAGFTARAPMPRECRGCQWELLGHCCPLSVLQRSIEALYGRLVAGGKDYEAAPRRRHRYENPYTCSMGIEIRDRASQSTSHSISSNSLKSCSAATNTR